MPCGERSFYWPDIVSWTKSQKPAEIGISRSLEKIAKPAEIDISRSLDKIAKKTAEIGISRSLDKIAKKNSRNRYIKKLGQNRKNQQK